MFPTSWASECCFLCIWWCAWIMKKTCQFWKLRGKNHKININLFPVNPLTFLAAIPEEHGFYLSLNCVLPCHATTSASHQRFVLALVLSLSHLCLSATAPAYFGEFLFNVRNLHFVVLPNESSHQLVKDQAARFNTGHSNAPSNCLFLWQFTPCLHLVWSKCICFCDQGLFTHIACHKSRCKWPTKRRKGIWWRGGRGADADRASSIFQSEW